MGHYYDCIVCGEEKCQCWKNARVVAPVKTTLKKALRQRQKDPESVTDEELMELLKKENEVSFDLFFGSKSVVK